MLSGIDILNFIEEIKMYPYSFEIATEKSARGFTGVIAQCTAFAVDWELWTYARICGIIPADTHPLENLPA